MTIRPAEFADCAPILDMVEQAQKRSAYATVSEIDKDYTREIFNQAVRSHGGHGDGACLFLVSESDDVVQGYFLGALSRTYQVGKQLSAQEWHYYLAPDADSEDAIRLLEAFMEWAESNPNVVEIRIGPQNVFGEPDGRFGALLEHKGLSKAGTLYTRRTGT